ncbi:LSM domain-containing protein [Rhizoctonia solani]|uniref:U6 snRNA-associated Sm-like protein LSm6 n=2 Tax=Rhizoctonia solani TaxID=456999 RepID=A0A8H8P2V5_9AGAM|nr:LSM domain-containing protein [Rhizoctonia solani]QRW23302.1 LSM domain-containing protein [Rhizoctonia solani]
MRIGLLYVVYPRNNTIKNLGSYGIDNGRWDYHLANFIYAGGGAFALQVILVLPSVTLNLSNDGTDNTPPPAPPADGYTPPPPPPAAGGSPTDFLKNVVGKRVVVRLTSGVDYQGVLSCLDGYMNIAMEQTEEHVNGRVTNRYGDTFIRGNNVLYISAAEAF